MDMRRILDIVQPVEEDVRAARISDIDIDDAIRHFDMPVDISRSDMKRAFAETKRQFAAMFKGQKTIKVYRGLIVEDGWKPSDGLGRSWSFDEVGALKGSGLSSHRNETDRNGKHPKGFGVMLIGEVSADDIDWLTTIAVNSFHEEEREIVIEEGSPVLIKAVIEADRLGVHEDYGVLSTPNATFSA